MAIAEVSCSFSCTLWSRHGYNWHAIHLNSHGTPIVTHLLTPMFFHRLYSFLVGVMHFTCAGFTPALLQTSDCSLHTGQYYSISSHCPLHVTHTQTHTQTTLLFQPYTPHLHILTCIDTSLLLTAFFHRCSFNKSTLRCSFWDLNVCSDSR